MRKRDHDLAPLALARLLDRLLPKGVALWVIVTLVLGTVFGWAYLTTGA